jgi:glutathione S-transferase
MPPRPPVSPQWSALMKLYYSPGSSSLASHIVLEEAGIRYETVRVSLKDKRTADGADYNAINPKGYVPSVQLDNNELLTENTALLAYLGEQSPQARLIAPAGTWDNYRVREWLGYISIELHKNCSPLFRPSTPDATVAAAREALARRLAYADQALAGKVFLVGEHFSVADAYLFVVTTWLPRLQVDLTPYPNLKAFKERVAKRPAVIRAMTDEGLLKAA